MPAKPEQPIILDSVTHIAAEHRGRVVYGGSHAGTYAAYYAAAKGVAAVVLNDAGIGRERAGVAGLDLLAGLGVPGAAVSHRTGRIGDGAHAVRHGVLSTVNGPAARLGLAPGMACGEALTRLCAAALPPSPEPPPADEARQEIAEAARGGIKVIALDSISLVTPDDRSAILVAASHGALLGGRPETAVKHPVIGVVVNDADRGIDDVGISRLPALEARGIAGACVSAFSARIGDGLSTYRDGYISAMNETAQRMGGAIGMSCADWCAAIATTAAGRR